MTNFHDLYEYNAWANRLVLAVTDEMTDEQMRAPMPELGGSALEVLGHLAIVEAAFVGLMTGDGRRPPEDMEYAGAKALIEANVARYSEALPSLVQRLEDEFEVPWFGRKFTVEQGLMQAATHSVQHRAAVCAAMARAGKKAPDLDYIIWLSQFR